MKRYVLLGLTQKWFIYGRSPQFFAGSPQMIADSCVSSILCLVTIGLLLSGWFTVRAQTTAPTLKFMPSQLEILLNQSATQQIELVSIDNFVGGSVGLIYDPRAVRLLKVEAGGVLSNLQPEVDYFMEVSPPKTLANGLAEVTIKLILITDNDFLTPGAWLQLTWQGMSLTQNSAVTFDPTMTELMNKNGDTIRPNVEVSAISIVPTLKPMTLQINLQGNKSSAPIQTLSGVHQAVVMVDTIPLTVPTTGQITLTSPPPYSQITVTRPGYLSAIAKNVTSTQQIHSIMLMAGDVNGDGRINIFDLSQLAAHYGQTVPITMPAAELEISNYITASSSAQKIDILDLALAAQNYGQSGPLVIK